MTGCCRGSVWPRHLRSAHKRRNRIDRCVVGRERFVVCLLTACKGQLIKLVSIGIGEPLHLCIPSGRAFADALGGQRGSQGVLVLRLLLKDARRGEIVGPCLGGLIVERERLVEILIEEPGLLVRQFGKVLLCALRLV